MYGPDENGNLANFSTVELVSLPDSLPGCLRHCDVVPESLRHYLENIQIMIKSKAELENVQPHPAACWDPVHKRNRAHAFWRTAKYEESSLLTEGQGTEMSDLGCPNCELGVGVTARSESLFLRRYGSN